MKLYAIVSSERASKGQGGNTRLTIVVSGAEGEQLAVINVFPPNDLVPEAQMTIEKFDGLIVHETKGEKQKGEVCQWCKDDGVKDADDCYHQR